MARTLSAALVFILFTLVAVGMSQAQSTEQTSGSGAPVSDASSQQAVATGSATEALARSLREAEAELFRQFNANNSSDRFDIECLRLSFDADETIRVCVPRFMHRAVIRNAHRIGQDFNVLTDAPNLITVDGDDLRRLQQEMADLVMRSDDFARSVLTYDRLARDYRQRCRSEIGAD